jgi:Ca2+-binding EF-hand superfamily protein
VHRGKKGRREMTEKRFQEVEKEFEAIRRDQTKLAALWKEIDFNGNGKVSLAEIDKLIVAKYSVLNNKPAMQLAYRKTTLKDGDGDAWVEKKEFRALLHNILYFTKVWDMFDDIDTGHDRRVDLGEFCSGCGRLKLNMSVTEAAEAFDEIDRNHGGQILFKELCKWVAKRAEFLQDGSGLEVTGSTGNDQTKE